MYINYTVYSTRASMLMKMKKKQCKLKMVGLYISILFVKNYHHDYFYWAGLPNFRTPFLWGWYITPYHSRGLDMALWFRFLRLVLLVHPCTSFPIAKRAKSAPIITGRDLHKYNTRRRQQHKQTYHRLKLGAITLPQDKTKSK